MKFALAVISIIGFASIAVFGFLAIGHINEMAHRGCLAALSQNGICPSASNVPLAAAFSHLNILKSFSTALLGNSILLLVLTILSFSSSVFLFLYFFAGAGRVSSFLPRLLRSGKSSISSSFDWLVIHFNSPSFVFDA